MEDLMLGLKFYFGITSKVYDGKDLQIEPWQGDVIGHQSGLLQSSMKWDIWDCEDTVCLGFEDAMQNQIPRTYLVIFIKLFFIFKRICLLISFLA